jgi:hypothetical protein
MRLEVSFDYGGVPVVHEDVTELRRGVSRFGESRIEIVTAGRTLFYDLCQVSQMRGRVMLIDDAAIERSA